MLDAVIARSAPDEEAKEVKEVKEVKMVSSDSSSSSDDDEPMQQQQGQRGRRGRRNVAQALQERKAPVAKIVRGDKRYTTYIDAYIGEQNFPNISERPDRSMLWYKHRFLAPGWSDDHTLSSVYYANRWARELKWTDFGGEMVGGLTRLTELRHLQNIIAVFAWWRYNYASSSYSACHCCLHLHKTEAGNTMITVEFWVPRVSRDLPYTPMLFNMPNHILTTRMFSNVSPHRNGTLHRPAMTRVYVGDALTTYLLTTCAQQGTAGDRKYLEFKWPQGVTSFDIRDYQKQSVARMMAIEKETCWISKDYAGTSGSASRLTGCWYNNQMWHKGLDMLKRRPTGGFNCEEMGLGKTVEMLMLIHLTKDVSPPVTIQAIKHYWTLGRQDGRGYGIGKSDNNGSATPFKLEHGDRLLDSKATLIICPTTLIATWNMELAKVFVKKPKSVAWYGPKRTLDMKKLSTEYDIVVTTPNMVKTSCHLSMIKWKRVIIDESHEVLRSGDVFRTLASDHRWCVSGTPVNVQKPRVLGHQLHFLGFTSVQSFNVPIANDDSNMEAATYIFKNLVVRHTKTQPFGDRKELLALPMCTLSTVLVPFDAPWQSEGYRNTVTRARREYRPRLSGPQVALLYSRVRRFCSMPKEVKDDGGGLPYNGNNNILQESKMDVAPELPLGVDVANLSNETCPLCLDAFDRPVQTTCRHVFCLLCLDEFLQRSQQAGRNSAPCPNCRTPVEAKQIKFVDSGAAPAADDAAADDALAAADAKTGSHKINRLKLELKNLPADDKIVIFCEFADTLDAVKKAVEDVLGKKGCVTLGGEMNAKR